MFSNQNNRLQTNSNEGGTQSQGNQSQVTFTPQQQSVMNSIIGQRVNEVRGQYQEYIAPNTQEYANYKQLYNAGVLSDGNKLNEFVNYYNQVPTIDKRISDMQADMVKYQNSINSLTSELTAYKHREVLSKAGVYENFLDFVEFSANKLAVGGKTFETAVSEFLKANPQFANTISNIKNTSAQDTQSDGNDNTETSSDTTKETNTKTQEEESKVTDDKTQNTDGGNQKETKESKKTEETKSNKETKNTEETEKTEKSDSATDEDKEKVSKKNGKKYPKLNGGSQTQTKSGNAGFNYSGMNNNGTQSQSQALDMLLAKRGYKR